MKSRQGSGGASRSTEARELPTWARRVSQAAVLGTMIAGMCASSAAFAESKPVITVGYETVDDDGDVVPQVATPTSSANTVTVPDDVEWSIDPIEIVEARGLRPVPVSPIRLISMHTAAVNFDISTLTTGATISTLPDGTRTAKIVPPHRGADGVYHVYAYDGNPTQIGVSSPDEQGHTSVIFDPNSSATTNTYSGTPTLWGHAEHGLSPLAQLAVDGAVKLGDEVTVTTDTAVLTYVVRDVFNTSKDAAAARGSGNRLNTVGSDPRQMLVTTCNFREDGSSIDTTTIELWLEDALPLAIARDLASQVNTIGTVPESQLFDITA